jgi:hypothetical protein
VTAVVRLAEDYRTEFRVWNSRSTVKREHTVFTRAVIDRERWAKVAAEVGLSRRQFIRDKRVISRWIAGRLNSRVLAFGAAAVDSLTADAHARIAAAYVQAECGDLSGASLVLHNVAQSSASMLTRFDALLTYAQILAEYSPSAMALVALNRARYVGASFEFERFESEVIAARLDIAESAILRQVAPIAEIRVKLQRAETNLRRAAANGNRLADAEIARALVQRGIFEHVAGQTRAARSALAAALERVRAATLADPVTRTDALTYLGHVLRESRSTLPDCLNTLRCASESASLAGLRSRALIVSLTLAQCEMLLGDRRRATTRAVDAIALAKAIGIPVLVLIATVNAAELLLVDLKNAAAVSTARRLLVQSARLAESHSFLWAMIRAKQATIALTRGDARGAIVKASEADACALKLGNQRIRATTLRILAESRARLGEPVTALELIHEAVEVSQRFGTWRSLGECLRVAATLTGDPVFTRRARELDFAREIAT